MTKPLGDNLHGKTTPANIVGCGQSKVAKRVWENRNACPLTDAMKSCAKVCVSRSQSCLFDKLVDNQAEALLLRDGYFCLLSEDGQLNNPDAAFKEFYKAKGQKKIPARVSFYAERMGVEPSGVRVLELKNRWASCTQEGRLNFHWKCMMAPSTIIDYIVVHELGHLRYMNHTKAFWNQVDKVLPDYLERKEWLRVNGAGMDL